MTDTVKRYLGLAPRDFPYLRRLTVLEQGLDGSDIELELCFCGAGERCLIVRCMGVRDLTFRQPFTTDMKLHSLEVHDLSTAQLEAIRFEVQDLERECLSHCIQLSRTHRNNVSRTRCPDSRGRGDNYDPDCQPVLPAAIDPDDIPDGRR